MLASTSGNGYCLSCAPPNDVPLVPATSSPAQFFRAKRIYEAAVREHNEDVRRWRRRLAPGSKPGSLRIVTEPREDPLEAEEMLIVSRVGRIRRPSKAGGRRRKLTAGDEEKLRRMVRDHPSFTVKMLADKERFNMNVRTMRHYLKRLGLKLKKPKKPKKLPARRARWS